MPHVLIGHEHGDGVAISVSGYANPDARDYWDGNWLRTDVAIRIGPWSGRYAAALRTDEFQRFLAEVEALDTGGKEAAVFEPAEPWLHFTLRRDHTGHIALEGEASPEGMGVPFGQVALRFRLQEFIDQTYLAGIAEQLRSVLAEFPVRGSLND
jgi:hypothetical protein